MPFVVDASMTLAWYFADEATPYTTAVRGLLAGTAASAPSSWPLEVANGLLAGERRQRLTRTQTERVLHLLAQLPIAVDETTPAIAWGSALILAREQRLSVYDASYLELAIREGLPLATQDARLQAAAARVGVPLVQAPAVQP